ncbi:hypothetical protein [Streptomyces sp. NPDC055992]|uniref:hypothetical protein n=1 Tax=Streptomyces sp. NPDC055992 TaxID=3345673 RepID=UPI0035D759B1
MKELPPEAHRAVQQLLAKVAGRRDLWPVPGGEEAAEAFGRECWVVYVAYLDGIEVRNIDWLG